MSDKQTPPADLERQLAEARESHTEYVMTCAEAISENGQLRTQRDRLAEALLKLQARFRNMYKTAGERREEAEKRGNLDAMQENACERSAYLQAAMEVTNAIDLLNDSALAATKGGPQ